MSIQVDTRHRLMLPDGTMQALDWSPHVTEGTLFNSAEIGLADEPAGKFVVTWIEERRVDGGPLDRIYHVKPF